MRLLSSVPIAMLFLVLSVGTQVEAQQGAPRFAYIDSEAILQEAPGAQEAQRQFEQDMGRYRAEVQQLAEELQTLITRFEQQQLSLSPEVKERREQEIVDKQGSYQRRIQELENQASERQAELVEPIMEQISQVIEAIRTEGNYAIIFDAASRSFIAADPSLDLTEQVIQRLRSGTSGRR